MGWCFLLPLIVSEQSKYRPIFASFLAVGISAGGWPCPFQGGAPGRVRVPGKTTAPWRDVLWSGMKHRGRELEGDWPAGPGWCLQSCKRLGTFSFHTYTHTKKRIWSFLNLQGEECDLAFSCERPENSFREKKSHFFVICWGNFTLGICHHQVISCHVSIEARVKWCASRFVVCYVPVLPVHHNR